MRKYTINIVAIIICLKSKIKGMMDYRDYLSIIIGLVALVCNLLLPCDEQKINIANIFCVLAGLLGFLYMFYAIILLLHRPKFDWHLINGHFLQKVVALVLLTPSVLTTPFIIYNFYKLFNAESANSRLNYSPKNMIYDENLYIYNEDVCGKDTLCKALANSTRDLLFSELHELEYGKDVITRKSKLPRLITKEQEDPSIYWSVYYHFIDPGNQHMTTTHSGRVWSSLIAILGVLLLNGLLVSSLINWFESRKEKWLNGKVKYPVFMRLRPHYVIIGGNGMVAGVVKYIFDKERRELIKKSDREKCKTRGLPYILIQTSRDVESFRRELFSEFTEEEQQKIIIYYGNRTSKLDIKDLHLEKAKEVFVLGEEARTDDIESYHDTMNMRCLDILLEDYKKTPQGMKIERLLPKVNIYREKLESANNTEERKQLEKEHTILINDWRSVRDKRLLCRVMFEYQTTFSVFQFYDLDESMDAFIDFRPFNYYEMWAQKVLINKEIVKEKLLGNFRRNGYLPLEGAEGIKADSNNYVHLFVVGMSRMGIAMAIEAAHLAHYPNYSERNKIRTKITFIDADAEHEKEFFMGRFKELFALSHWRYGTTDGKEIKWIRDDNRLSVNYDYLGGDFLDIEWEFINGGVENATIQDYIYSSSIPEAKVTIAICHTESNRSHAAALYLQKRIYESTSVLQVLVYNRYGSSIIDSLSRSGTNYPYCGKLRGFGCARYCFNNKDNILERSERIGNAIGEFYGGDSPLTRLLSCSTSKSKSACSWSNMYNGNTLWTKLRSVDYNPETFKENKETLDVLAKVEHNRWNVEQLLMNYRVVTLKQQMLAVNDKTKKNEYKHQMAHLNICSNETLAQKDAGAMEYDRNLTRCLSDIYQNHKGND